MDEKQGTRMGKIVFWVTFAFCSWIIWYITGPVADYSGKVSEEKPAETAKPAEKPAEPAK